MIPRVRQGALALCSSVLGCSLSPARSLVSERLPDDVEYTALLLQDGSGRVLDSTGLVERTSGTPIGVPLPESLERAAFVQLFGFRASELAAVGFEARDATAPITLATPDDPALPAPSYYETSRVFDGRGTLEGALDPPFITAGWLSPCARLVPGESRLVDSRCHATYCGLVARQSGCVVEIDADDLSCAPGSLAGRLDAGNRLVVPGCSPATPAPGASAAILCDGIRPFPCRIEILPEAAPPRLVIRTASLISDPEEPPDSLPAVAVGGYLFGLEVFDDRIVVATDDGRAAWSNECSANVPGRFYFLDPETLQTTGTATSPPCVRDLVRNPGRDELFAVFGPENGRSLGRFAKDGRLLERALIPERPDSEHPLPIVVHRLSDRVSVAFQNSDGVQLHTFHRTPALAHEWSSQTLENMANHQERDTDVIAILERRTDEIHLLDPTKPDASPNAPFFPSNAGMGVRFSAVCENIGLRPEQMLYLPGEGWLLGSRNERTGWIIELSLDGTDCDVIRWFEGPAEIYDFALWPTDPDLVLAGVRNIETGRAYLSLLSRSEERFLTGSVDIGEGAVYHMRADDRGRVFMTLPWTGDVVRAEMR